MQAHKHTLTRQNHHLSLAQLLPLQSCGLLGGHGDERRKDKFLGATARAKQHQTSSMNIPQTNARAEKKP